MPTFESPHNSGYTAAHDNLLKTQLVDKSKGVTTALKGLRDMMKINTDFCNNDKIALQISPRGIET